MHNVRQGLIGDMRPSCQRLPPANGCIKGTRHFVWQVVKMKMESQDVEALAEQLESLALELRRMVKKGKGVGKKKDRPVADERLFVKGKKVRVTIKGEHFGRVGKLTGRHGQQYWDIELDPREGEAYRVIYKKESSLALVE